MGFGLIEACTALESGSGGAIAIFGIAITFAAIVSASSSYLSPGDPIVSLVWTNSLFGCNSSVSIASVDSMAKESVLVLLMRGGA